MFLKHKKIGDMVKIFDVDTLFDPCKSSVSERLHTPQNYLH